MSLDLLLLDNNRVNKLLTILCCPRCYGDLEIVSHDFYCKKCNAKYPCDDGIIRLCISSGDRFIEAEKQLYIQKKRGRHKESMAFSSQQYEMSKEHFVRTIMEQGVDFSSKVVLHVGCGSDYFMAYFKDCLFYFSADITEETLKEIHKCDLPNTIIIHCSVEALPFKQNSVDCILCRNLVHHFYSRGIYIPLNELIRCLKPRGIIFLEEINKYGLFRLAYSFFSLPFLNIMRRIKASFRLYKDALAPATYEAPLSASKVLSVLKTLSKKAGKGGFEVEFIPVNEYLNIGSLNYQIYKCIGMLIPAVTKFLGYHWFIILRNINDSSVHGGS